MGTGDPVTVMARRASEAADEQGLAGTARALGAEGSEAAVVDVEPLATGAGYWVVDEAGTVTAFGDAAPIEFVSR